MQTLIAAFDIYGKAGGGESFFRRLLKSNPADSYTILSSDDARTALPQNVTAVRVHDMHRRVWREQGLGALPDLPGGLDLSREGERIAHLLDIASAVHGRSFDVIEIPDYLVHGWLLIPFLKHFQVRWGKIVLSMHGTISDALRDNWPLEGVGDLSLLENTESLLFRASDVRYAIGAPYAQAWSRTERLPVHMLDPLEILDLDAMSGGALYTESEFHRAPDLAFVGRQDRWKGPDLFLEIASLLPAKAYDYLHLYGPSTQVYDRSSLTELARVAENRGVKYHTNRQVAHPLLLETFAKESIVTVLPSRRDTFNLVALESLLNGCPTAISTRCGAVDFLDRAMPDLDFVRLDLGRLAEGARDILAVLQAYPEHRRRLRGQLQRLEPRRTGRVISEIHAEPSTADAAALALGEQVAQRILRAMRPMLQSQAGNTRRELLRDFSVVKSQTGFTMGDEAFDTSLTVALELSQLRDELGFDAPSPDRARLLAASSDVVARLSPRINAGDRAPIYEVLSSLERARGNPAIFAAYTARLMRLRGRAEPQDVDALCETLQGLGLVEEAKVARMSFTPGQPGLYDYLHHRLAHPPGPPPEGIVDRVDLRRPETPRVTVVVSLYNGAKKLRRFIDMLASQVPEAQAVMEVVFVDSNSLDDTREVIEPLLTGPDGQPRLSALYVRTRERETIQKAWNRGILEARGDVLTFLGNDEAMRADTIPKFLAVLDADPAIDWVQGDALVTEVDPGGELVRDLFPHRRSGDRKDAQYLECCFIGFAGAAYRRSLHDRFGFYDDAFKGAGDNEWKNRILHRINLHSLPETLGYFLNYPETRTTESPNAELEDIRAWYAFRTPEGIRYAFEHQSDDRCVDQFHRALAYRRSYSTETSTDLEYAAAMAAYLRQHRPEAYRRIEFAALPAGMVLEGYRVIDDIDLDPGPPGLWRLEHDMNTAKGAARLVMEGAELLRRRGHDVPFWYRNDNRSQQHYFPWPSMQRLFDPGPPLEIADVAGAQDVADLLAAAQGPHGAETAAAQARKGLAGRTHLDVWIPWADPEDDAPLAVLVEGLAARAPELQVLVTGPARSGLAQVGDTIHAGGPIVDDRPLFAAAGAVALPGFDLAAGRRLLRHAVDALWRGVPLVVGRGVAEALEALAPRATEALTVADTPAEMAELLAASRGGPRQGSDSARALAVRLQADGRVSRDAPVAERFAWTDDMRAVGALLQAAALDGAAAPAALSAFDVRLADAAFRETADAVLTALLVERRSPLLGVQEAAFVRLAALPAPATLDAAYARLYLLAGRRTLAAADALAGSLRGEAHADWAASVLGAWRSATPPPGRRPGKGIVLLADAAFWTSSEGERIAADARARLGDDVSLGSGGAPAFDEPAPLRGPALDRRLAEAALVAVLAGPSADRRLPAFELWARALASGAAVIGSGDALWFTRGLPSPALTGADAETLARLPDAAGAGLADLERERERLLETLGLTPWRVQGAGRRAA